MANKSVVPALHHWWPRTLAQHWAAADGMVSVMRPSGEIRRAPPGAFGAIRNAHHIEMGGPWASTFEPIFDQPDSETTDLVRWLATLDTPLIDVTKPRIERITPQVLSDERGKQMTRIVASLLARSPAIRHSIQLGTEYPREHLGLVDPNADKTLIAINQRGLYDAYRKCMEGGGRWAILFSDEREFIAGDGFLHNFPASQYGINSGRKLLLPILPTAAIVYMAPMQYPAEPRLVTMRLGASEVGTVNQLVQVYARDFIFFREQKPELTEFFKIARHRVFKYSGHDWLDDMLDDLSQYNRWGSGGAAGMSGIRPYSEGLKTNRWLETFAERMED